MIEASELDKPGEKEGDCQKEQPDGSFGNGKNNPHDQEDGETDKHA
jgi:hypothetical protein